MLTCLLAAQLLEGPFGVRQATTMSDGFAILADFDDVKVCDWSVRRREEDASKHYDADHSDISGSP